MPAIENSDAEVVILGGDFNDHPLSGEKIGESRKLDQGLGIVESGGLGNQGIQNDGRIGGLGGGFRGVQRVLGDQGDWELRGTGG